MKYLLTTIICTLLLHTAYGQKVHFSDSSNIWKVFTNTCANKPYSEFFSYFHYENDTVIAGSHYRKMTMGGCTPYLFIREDTVSRKVFVRSQYLECQKVDTGDIVLYDYNMQVGSTIINNYMGSSTPYYSKHHVQSIDSTLIGGYYYKVWHMISDTMGQFVYAPYQYDIIEGIGTTVKPYYTRYPYWFEVCYRLTCFTNNGQAKPLNPAVGVFDNVVSCAITGVNEVMQRNALSVYPNPANNATVVELKYGIKRGQLDVYNVLGEDVYHTNIDNRVKILIGKYLSIAGQYFYRITDNSNGQTYTGKFIFE